MIETVYGTLAKIGYTHPLHSPLTPLVVGLVTAGFLFGFIAWVLGRSGLAQTARHCMILALIALLPTILLGYMDWHHRFGGSWSFAIKAKLILSVVLLVLLSVAVGLGYEAKTWSKNIIITYAFCFFAVIGLGYFGVELLYGEKKAVPREVQKKSAGEEAPLPPATKQKSYPIQKPR